jgi:hypothetical protein
VGTDTPEARRRGCGRCGDARFCHDEAGCRVDECGCTGYLPPAERVVQQEADPGDEVERVARAIHAAVNEVVADLAARCDEWGDLSISDHRDYLHVARAALAATGADRGGSGRTTEPAPTAAEVLAVGDEVEGWPVPHGSGTIEEVAYVVRWHDALGSLSAPMPARTLRLVPVPDPTDDQEPS